MGATFTSDAPTEALTIYAQITDAATASYDYTLTRGLRVYDAFINKTGGGTGVAVNTVQILSTAAAVTDAVSINGAADNAMLRATQINDANNSIITGGILRVTVTKAGGDAQVDVFVYAIAGPAA